MSVITRSHGKSMLRFVRNLHTVFQSSCTIAFPSAMNESPCCSTSWPAFGVVLMILVSVQSIFIRTSSFSNIYQFLCPDVNKSNIMSTKKLSYLKKICYTLLYLAGQVYFKFSCPISQEDKELQQILKTCYAPGTMITGFYKLTQLLLSN